MIKKKIKDKETDLLDIFVFNPPLPPIRIPNSSTETNTNSNLVFKNKKNMKKHKTTCINHVTKRCEEGARFGCSMRASQKCRLPWALKIINNNERHVKNLETCQENTIRDCMKYAEKNCQIHAKTFCSSAFTE